MHPLAGFSRRSSVSGFSNQSLYSNMSGLSNQSSCSNKSLSRSGSDYIYPRQRLYQALPGRRFICIKNYKPQKEGELQLKKGQFVEGAYLTINASLHV